KNLNKVELMKVITAWAVSGGSAYALFQALFENLSHIINNPDLASVLTKGMTAVTSVVVFVLAVKTHMATGVPEPEFPPPPPDTDHKVLVQKIDPTLEL